MRSADLIPRPRWNPNSGAFYWITPIPGNWPKDRIESKLREYNTYGVQELTIHEAMPGHYVQFEFANAVQPKTRRLLRNLFGNGPYVEGWAVYTQQLMSDEGYLNNSAALRMTFLKQMLRVITNTILDIRIQTMGMTEQEALDLMMKDAFQEKEEATAKWQRAQLSSTQLPTYFVGWRGWLRLRAEAEKRPGVQVIRVPRCGFEGRGGAARRAWAGCWRNSAPNVRNISHPAFVTSRHAGSKSSPQKLRDPSSPSTA